MNKVNREAIKQLLEAEDSVALSLYLPTHRFPTSEHISEDKIRLKNLMRAGKEALEKKNVDDAIIKKMINNLEEGIYDSISFWSHTTEGTAIFCSPAGVQYFHLPMECDEYVSMGDTYDIAPLLAVTTCDQPYYLLALATRNPALYAGDMYGLQRVDIDLPKNPKEALGIDELFSHSQTARAGSYQAGNPGVKSHGQGDSKQAGQEERLKFFRLIDEKIQSSKQLDKNMPILLAGTDEEVSRYRESSRSKHLLEAYLSGNYTDAPPHEIHARSWPLVLSELCHPEQMKEIEKVHSLLGTGRASTENQTIQAAAAEGRVDSLLVGCFTKTRDSVSDSDEEITKLAFFDEYRTGKVSASARSVFDNGGRVIGILKDSMPDGVQAAAVYRY